MSISSVHVLVRRLAAQFNFWRGDYFGTTDDFGAVYMDEAFVSLIPSLLVVISESGETSRIVDSATLKKLAQILATGAFMSWAAHDPVTHAFWNPLRQSYKVFKKAFPDAEPYLATHVDVTALEEQLIQFFNQFSQHGQPF